MTLAEMEREAVVTALKERGTLDRAARALGITRWALIRLIKKHRIKYSYGTVRN
jgi:transcriptional regulator with GAF, ATPase, and Fis domain